MNLVRWVLLLWAGALMAAEAPKIVYTKSFPRSVPPFVRISIDKTGAGEYREAPDEDPLLFRLGEQDTAALFALAEKLDYFKRPLEAKAKVAHTGIKTFRYENGAEGSQTQFNYSADPDAQKMWDWFERITETEQHLITLERVARFDKLGVHDALLRLEVLRDRNRLVAPEQFLKILDRIAKNETYLHMARSRAAHLAEGFRAPAQPAATAEAQ